MAASEDTEITLGTGKMLALFFGLVALCAVFFGMGFSLGKNSGRTNVELQGGTGASAVRPTAVKAAEARAPSDLTFYKAVEQKDPQADLTAKSADTLASTAAKGGPADADAPPDPTAISGQNSYFVQVAAVSKQEDAAALVDALKKKQYAAFAASAGGDKLFHVQVGPFADIKDAETARGQLVKDGYNPILKK
ncbi:MAG: SPOR domain-containing protein [Acidobacteriia bacterium]|nr:SPOR domain-containing protein [Terriglobia bacterium]